VTNARDYYSPRAATGAAGTRLSLRPLIFVGRGFAQLGRIAPREGAGVCVLAVVARSECDEAIHSFFCGYMDCFASLAMTVVMFV
jgi:hypothetical protein